MFLQTYSASKIFKNGKVIEDNEEQYEIKNNKGKYIKKKFGKIIDERDLVREEINKLLYPNYFLDEETFDEASEILEEELSCKSIKQKYSISNKNEMKKKYRKKALQVHPDKCKSPKTKKQCKEEFQELNREYEYFNTNC